MSGCEGGECVVMEGLIPVTAFYDPRTEPGITSCSWAGDSAGDTHLSSEQDMVLPNQGYVKGNVQYIE